MVVRFMGDFENDHRFREKGPGCFALKYFSNSKVRRYLPLLSMEGELSRKSLMRPFLSVTPSPTFFQVPSSFFLQ
jgi:hypothetical protein